MILQDTAFVYPISDVHGAHQGHLVCFRGASTELFSDGDAGQFLVGLMKEGVRQVVYMRWERPWTLPTATADYKNRTDPVTPRWLVEPSGN
jgi:hypothetical protein